MTGPVYLVTGASKGIGKAITLLALKNFSARVVAVARSHELLESLKAQVNDHRLGDYLEIVAGDVCHEQTCRRAVNVALDKWGRLDVVVANAG
jgi:NADP-dependent 3-hydroxy acid dehydrogenase YdfG